MRPQFGPKLIRIRAVSIFRVKIQPWTKIRPWSEVRNKASKPTQFVPENLHLGAVWACCQPLLCALTFRKSSLPLSSMSSYTSLAILSQLIGQIANMSFLEGNI